jgi:hypothetical protein
MRCRFVEGSGFSRDAWNIPIHPGRSDPNRRPAQVPGLPFVATKLLNRAINCRSWFDKLTTNGS